MILVNTVIFANENEDSAPRSGDEVNIPQTRKKKHKKKYTKEQLYELGNKNRFKSKKAINYYKRSCNMKYAKACYLLASAYINGRFYGEFKLEKNEEEALKYYKKACEFGDKSSCNKKSKAEKIREREIKIAERKIEREKKNKERKLKLEKSCELERSSSCRSLAYTYYHSKDYENSKIYFKKACDLEDRYSCCNLGEIYLEKDDDLKNAEKFIKKSCDLDNKHGCKLMIYLEDQKKCINNVALSCRNLAKAYLKGDGFNRNRKSAYKYYLKACNLNDAESCKLLADDLDNKKEAKEFYQKACKAGDKYSCKTVIFLDYDSECKSGVAKSCDKVGSMYDKGSGVILSVRIANKYFQKACELGYKKACNK
jgi:hypothetical protein